ncbi:MAG: 50S ribosomal protein L15 [Myxococcales bacterium FL481]|nr:MAG: 50S ribosomal protein L15 [Myxococcales bacterium FL481]
MGTTLHTLAPPAGHRRRRKRVGRGPGSGTGKTSGRGMKGQLARHDSMSAAFEGGQLPIHRRVPKRGFVNIHRVEVFGLNLRVLDQAFEDGDAVTLEALHTRGLIPKRATLVKLLADGELSKKLTVSVHRASERARAKLEAAGGTLELVPERSRSKATGDGEPAGADSAEATGGEAPAADGETESTSAE